ncbi:MAG: Txe/YoeB family addiction module toxin [Puniceicoccales bacterium]|jgi:toxin YoeB|nr:Txe/YoeB family addiction module toxin [Puniceicoccales bacterium]
MLRYETSTKFDREYDGLCKSNSCLASKVDELVAATLEQPRGVIGRPERLKHKAKEVWSRHIDRKNRLVYSMLGDNTVRFEQCLGHYNDH